MIKFLTVAGIVVGSIILLLLILLLMFLFVPFRYKFGGTNITDEYGYAIFSYLFSIFRIKVYYHDKNGWVSFRLFGIRIINKTFPEFVELVNKIIDFFDKHFNKQNETAEKSDEQGTLDTELNEEEVKEAVDFIEQHDEIEDMGPIKKNISFIAYIKDIVLNIRKKWYNFKEFVNKKIADFNLLKKKIKFYYRVLQCPSLKPTLMLLKDIGIKLMKHSMPKKLRVKLKYGNEDAYVNAKFSGYIFILQGILQKEIDFTPAWNENAFEIEGYMSGRVQMYVFLNAAWKIFTSKHLRRMIKLFRKGGKISG